MEPSQSQTSPDAVSVSQSSVKKSGVFRNLVIFALLLFGFGLVAALWAVMHSKSVQDLIFPAPQSEDVMPNTPIASAAKVPVGTLSDAEARMALLESRLARAEGIAATAYDDAARAERLLILVATRRALDRGQPLGFLEAALQRNFGADNAADVGIILAGARQPVTLNQLLADLDTQASRLSGPELDGPVHREIWRKLSTLVVVRKSDEPSQSPTSKVQRARAALQLDHVNSAIAELSTLPAAYEAKPWLDKARRYARVRAALDKLEMLTLSGGSAPVPVDKQS